MEWTTTPTSGGYCGSFATGAGSPVRVGEVWSMSARYATSSGMALLMDVGGGGATWTDAVSGSINHGDGTFTSTLVATVATVSDGALTPLLRPVSGKPAAGDVWFVGDYLTERTGTIGAYFDGSTSPDPDLTPSWTGTPNASESILSGTHDKRQDLRMDGQDLRMDGLDSRVTKLDSRVTKLDSREYYGPHRPDVPSRFTTDGSDGALAALAWINAAPSGSTYYSVDGPQGAWVWRKRGTTWVCVEGNTGPVDLLPKMTADWTATVATLTRTATGADLNIYAIPAASIVGASMATARTMFSAIPLTLWPYPINIGVASFGIHGAGSLALSRNYETPTTFILRTRGSGTFSATEYALANTFPITSGSAWPTTLTI